MKHENYDEINKLMQHRAVLVELLKNIDRNIETCTNEYKTYPTISVSNNQGDEFIFLPEDNKLKELILQNYGKVINNRIDDLDKELKPL